MEELLHRQVHPDLIQDGKVTSSAFRPSPRDEKKLSVDRDSVFEANESYDLHTKQKGLESAGTWSVSVGECVGQSLEVLTDPITGSTPNPAHCLINFESCSRSQMEKKSKKLRDLAVTRGRSHPK